MVEVDEGKQKLRLSFQAEVFAATVPKEQQLWVTNWFWFEHELTGDGGAQGMMG